MASQIYDPAATAAALAATQTDGDRLHAWRVARFAELGYGECDAELLATAKAHAVIAGRKGAPQTCVTPLYWGTVAAVLAAGATHAQALAIFA